MPADDCRVVTVTSDRVDRMSLYDLDRGDLLTTFEIVNLAFDIKARAAMSIPANIRSAERALVHEDLAPRPWTQSSQMHAE